MKTLTLLFAFLAAHALCDYPLQGDFLARAKNHRDPIYGVPWGWALVSHSMIHAAAVALLTGSPVVTLIEFGAHTAIDWAKCEGLTDYNIDQILHVLCKFFYVIGLALCS